MSNEKYAGKQCTETRTDAVEHGIWLGPAMFAINVYIENHNIWKHAFKY